MLPQKQRPPLDDLKTLLDFTVALYAQTTPFPEDPGPAVTLALDAPLLQTLSDALASAGWTPFDALLGLVDAHATGQP